MIIDFGLLKSNLGTFADSFDHALMVWNEDEVAKKVAMDSSERVVYSPYNLTAENMSKMFFMGAMGILNSCEFQHNEDNVQVHSVIVHETTTGYAQCFEEDISFMDIKRWQEIAFSSRIRDDWKDTSLGRYIRQVAVTNEERIPLILPKEV